MSVGSIGIPFIEGVGGYGGGGVVVGVGGRVSFFQSLTFIPGSIFSRKFTNIVDSHLARVVDAL